MFRTQNTVYTITANTIWVNVLAELHCCLPYNNVKTINSSCSLRSCPTSSFLWRDSDSPDTITEANIKKLLVLKEAQLGFLYFSLRRWDVNFCFQHDACLHFGYNMLTFHEPLAAKTFRVFGKLYSFCLSHSPPTGNIFTFQECSEGKDVFSERKIEVLPCFIVSQPFLRKELFS